MPGGWNELSEGLLICISGSCFWMKTGTSSGTVVHNTLHMSCPRGCLASSQWSSWVPRVSIPRECGSFRLLRSTQKLALWSKWHLLSIIRSRSLNTSAHRILVLKLPRKIRHSQTRVQRRDRACFSSGCLSPIACGFLLASYAGQ